MYSVPSRTPSIPAAGQCEKKKSSERPRRHGHLSGGRRRRGLLAPPERAFLGCVCCGGQRIMNRKGPVTKAKRNGSSLGLPSAGCS